MDFLTIVNMIIHLDDTIKSVENIPIEEAEDLFSELIIASIKGRHLIVINRALCNWAKENLTFRRRHEAHLNRLIQTYSTSAGIVTSAKSILEITIGNDVLTIRGDNFKMGHKKLLKSNYCEQATSFVTENGVNDTDFYQVVFKEVRSFVDIPNVAFEPIHGGGTTTVDQFEKEISKNNVVVCIVDTDQHSPISRKSSTCTKVLKSARKNRDKYVGNIFETVGREIENYIPLHVLEHMKCYSNVHISPIISSYANEDTPKIENPCFWHYLDIKEGLNGKKMMTARDAGKVSDDDVDWIKNKLKCNDATFDKLDQKGFGKHVVQNFIKCGFSRGVFHKYCRTEYWRKIFLEYFKSIIWYFCAAEKNRT